MECLLIPRITTKNNKTIESNLFKDLWKLTSDRDLTKMIWGAVTAPQMKSLFELDENGEPTIESVLKNDGISKYINKDNAGTQSLKYGFSDINGMPKTFESVFDVYDKVDDFNSNEKKYSATINTTDTGFTVSVVNKNIDSADKANTIQFENKLSKRLYRILNSIGFDVKIGDTSENFFDPRLAERSASQLKTVIQIARGERGEEALPEEFSHVIVEGLKNTTLGIRALKIFDDIDTIKMVLEDDFDAYNKKYNKDISMLKKEALAKLMAKYLINRDNGLSIIDRFWNSAKNYLKELNVTDVDNIIEESRSAVEEIIEDVFNDTISEKINKDLVLSSKRMHKLQNDVSKLEDMARNELALLQRKTKLLASRSDNGLLPKEDYQRLREIEKLVESKEFAAASYLFIKEAAQTFELLNENIKEHIDNKDKRISEHGKENYLCQMARLIRRANEYSNGFIPSISELSRIDEFIESGEVSLNEADAKLIKTEAQATLDIINKSQSYYKNNRYEVVFEFLKKYWGEDKIMEIGRNKGKAYSLQMILQMADNDIRGIDRWVNSLSINSDLLSNLIHSITREQIDEKQEIVLEITRKILAATEKIIAAGYDPSFIYERDENGIPTGFYISDYDYKRFREEYKAEKDRLKEAGTSYAKMKIKLNNWVDRHMKSNEIETYDFFSKITRVPIYKKEKSLKETLSKAEYEYYRFMIDTKSQLDMLFVNKYTNPFKVPQIMNGLFESLDLTDPTKSTKKVLSTIKDRFVSREDDTDFGDIVEDYDESEVKIDKNNSEASINVLLGLDGNVINKIPANFLRTIKDKTRISTDAAASLIAYADAAVSYSTMSGIIDIMELVREHIMDREVQQRFGDKPIVNTIHLMKQDIRTPFTKKGAESLIGDRINDYFEMIYYGKKKNDKFKATIGNTEIDVAKLIDATKDYYSKLALGINPFSGISNVTMGDVQFFIEASAKQWFNHKDTATATTFYWRHVANVINDISEINPHNILTLLIDEYDALDELNQKVREMKVNNNKVARILYHGSIMILNTMGEHYLHTKTMLARLSHVKVKDGDIEKSLLDCYEVRKYDDGAYYLAIKKGVRTLDGKLIGYSEEDSDEIKNEAIANYKELKKENKPIIRRLNQKMHGGYSEEEAGAIKRNALGRLAMQFRQWMPEHYARRLKTAYYDTQLDSSEQGYDLTLGRFILNIGKDLVHANLHLKLSWNNLSDAEKANIRRAFAELKIFALLQLSFLCIGPAKDHKGDWAARMLIYQLKRLELEVGASIPFDPKFVSDLGKIVKEPVASADLIEDIFDVLTFSGAFTEIQSGPYKGWSRWEKNAFGLIPVGKQIKKLNDISEFDDAFKLFM